MSKTILMSMVVGLSMGANAYASDDEARHTDDVTEFMPIAKAATEAGVDRVIEEKKATFLASDAAVGAVLSEKKNAHALLHHIVEDSNEEDRNTFLLATFTRNLETSRPDVWAKLSDKQKADITRVEEKRKRQGAEHDRLVATIDEIMSNNPINK